ncbi:MAG: YbaK/EbsC family protein [Burkholderiales bacterium]|nr:YbaK/EbsC family protein [Burkholderiales bacterium]
MHDTNEHPAVARVRAALSERAHTEAPRWLDGSARTAAEAAAQLGVPQGAIAKSVILRDAQEDAVWLCITAGDRRVNAAKLPAPTARADADCVRRHSGFAIGGVSPLGFAPQEGASAPRLLMDESLWRFERVWAAAGHPMAVFPATPDELLRISGATRAVFTDD